MEGAVDYLSAYTLSQPKYTVQIREDNREIIFNHNTYVRLPQKNRLKYGDSCKRFPYLVKIIELFALDNFTYPASLDNVIDYWNVYKDIAIVRKELKAKYVKKIDEITFRKLENNKSDISLINTDTGFCMVYGCDTLFKTRKTVSVFPIPNRDLEYLPALNKYI